MRQVDEETMLTARFNLSFLTVSAPCSRT